MALDDRDATRTGTPPEAGRPSLCYRAFISYSHSDARRARRLQSRLEDYRLPPDSHVRTGSIPGSGPRRLGPMFRDRADLPAANDLTEAVKDALACTQSLIIVCSPDARASKWVDREIRLFRELNPDARIFAALVRGEPSDSFPDALLEWHAEPLAADLRSSEDGYRIGFLKLVAGLAGVPLDDLVQRDAHRRVRRMGVIALLATILALIVAALAVLAFDARADAEARRGEAEDLVEFMLTDLRERLRADGKLDTMSAVNQRALAYYGGQADLSRLSDDSLLRRARVLHAMGEDDSARGALAAARMKFREAARTTAEVLDRSPGNPQAVFNHAQSEFWLGENDYLRGDYPAAARRFHEYRAAALQLANAEPGNPDWQRELAYAEGNLCAVHLATAGSPRAALPHCEAALEFQLSLGGRTGTDPAGAMDLANALAWAADARNRVGDTAGAYRARRQQAALLDRLRLTQPDNFDLLDMWLTAQVPLAEFEAADDPIRARKRLTGAEVQARRLVAEDVSNAVWQSRLTAIADARTKVVASTQRGE